MRRVLSLWLGAAALLIADSAGAAGSLFDSASIEYGSGSKVSMVRLGLQSNWKAPLWRFSETQIGGYWDFSASFWRGTRHRGLHASQSLAAIGVTPVFRWERHDQRGPYGEFGIGAHLLSELYNNNGDRMSTRFQFGDHIGVGYRWDRVDLGLKFQHYSNGGIKKPNPGVDFVALRLLYAF